MFEVINSATNFVSFPFVKRIEMLQSKMLEKNIEKITCDHEFKTFFFAKICQRQFN